MRLSGKRVTSDTKHWLGFALTGSHWGSVTEFQDHTVGVDCQGGVILSIFWVYKTTDTADNTL